MSCDYAVHTFLSYTVENDPRIQQFCQTYRISPTDLVTAFDIFYETVRMATPQGQTPTDQQNEQFERMIHAMEAAGIKMPDHAMSHRTRIVMSALHEMIASVANASEGGDDPEGRIGVILNLAKVNRSLSPIRPIPQPRVDSRQIGYDRATMERIAEVNPVAAALLDVPPLPAPDWNADAIAELAERVRRSGARIELPSPAEVQAFLRSRIPRPAAMAPTSAVTAVADRIAMHLRMWAKFIREGYISVDGRPAQQVPSSLLGSIMGFTLFGPPGTGKSELFRQIAACISWVDEDGNVRYGVPYVGIEIPPNGSFGEVLGRPSYGKDGELYFRPTPSLLAAMCGGVVVFDEIIRSARELSSAIQAALEVGHDGSRYLRIPSPEGGLQAAFRLHPSTIIGTTYNPGHDGLGWNLSSAFTDRSTTLAVKPLTPAEAMEQLKVGLRQFGFTDLSESEKTQIRSLLDLVGEVNRLVGEFDPRMPGIEQRRLLRLVVWALQGQGEQMKWELESALPPIEREGAQHVHDAFENIFNVFRSRLSHHAAQHRRQ